MAGLHFDITGDNSNLLRKLQETEKGIRSVSQTVEKEGGNIEALFNRIAKSAAVFGAGFTAKEFVTQVAQVRGEFQKLEVAFTTMLGSKAKAEELMAQMVRTAATTPFSLQDVAGGAKQLLAYGVAAEDVNQTLIRLGDIAAGLSIPLGDLVYLYGTTRAQGRLYTEDFNQFTSRGIPMIEMLAKKFNVAESEVKGLVEAGKVGFPEVQEVIENLTNEGGKFGGLMEAQSKTIAGQISNIEDSISQMFNEIGQANEGIISDALSGVSSLVENYEKVGTVIAGLVAVYGTYKVAVMTVTALQSLQATGIAALTTKEIIHYGWLVATQKAQMLLNATMLANPYVAVAVAVAGVAAAIWTLSDRTSAAEKATKNFNQILDENTKKQEEHKEKIDELTAIIENNVLSEGERLAAFEKLKAEYPNIFDKYLTETEYLKEIVKYKKLIAEEDAKRANADDIEALRLAELKLQEYRNRKTQGVTMIDMNGNGWGDTNVNDAINAQLAIVNQAKAKVAEPEVNSFLAKIKELKDSDIASVIDDIDLSLKALENSGNNAIAIVSSLGGEFSKGQLDMIKSALASEQKAREKGNGNYQEDYDAAKKVWEDAKKKLQEIEADKKKFTAKQYTDAKADYADKKKKFESLGGITSDNAIKEADERKKKQQQIADELLQLRRTNQQNEINLLKEGSEKKRRQIELDYQKEIDEVKKQRKLWEEAQGGKLTAEQREALGNRASNAMQVREKGLAKVTEDENRAAIEANERYLKSYGTFLQKRDAITSEYTRKISEATTQGDKNILQKQMEEALSSLNLEKLKQGINWELVFGDLDKVSKESLNKVKQQLKDFKNSEEYKNMSIDQKKVIDEALNNIQTVLIDKGGLLGDLPHQLNELAKAQEELAQAQNEYNKAMESGTDAQKEAATKKLNDAQIRQQNAQVNVQKSADKTINNLTTLSNVITELGSNSELSLSQVGNLAMDVANVFTDIGEEVGGIIGAAFSLLDAIGSQGLDGFVGNVFGSVFKAVGGIFDTLTFGLIGNKESDPHLKEDVERLTQSNQDLKMALDNLAEKMEDSAVADAPELYEQQKKNIEQSMANTQEMMRRSGAAYSNGFLGMGGTHSSNKRVNDAMSAADWERISKVAGTTVRDVGDFWNLTSEQMYNVLMGAEDLYSKIKSYADDGHENAAQYMDEYIGYWKQLEELEEAYYEKLTSVSFDTVKNDFKSLLLDMESDSEDFAESFEKMMQEAIIESMISDTYAKRLKEWYKKFADSMGNDGSISKDEQNSLKQQWDDIVNDALKERNDLMESMGLATSSGQGQKATNKGFETMSQEQAGELNGRFTALYEVGLQILQNISVLQSIGVSTDSCNTTLLEIRNLMISSNGHLEDISGFVKKILEGFGEKLDNINTNIKNGLQ